MNDNSSPDLLIIGGGAAGLMAGITALERGDHVVLVSKGEAGESNTRYAQGGIAAAIDVADSPEQHALDTISCGSGLNNRAVVETVAGAAREVVDLLGELGLGFDREDDDLALTREAAHSRSRVVHAGGDETGRHLELALLKQFRARGGVFVEQSMAEELLQSGERIVGARILRQDGQVAPANIFAPRVILATGGAGQLYTRTTNPSIATGDGIALAYRAGAEVMDLEFFQFHPTALALPGAPAFLLSETLRGEGGVLRDAKGRSFMQDYHPDGELAPRDVVSRAIWSEMRRAGTSHVELDVTHLPKGYLRRRFPSIFETCAEWGPDISTETIPVAPAAHYFMGGVRTDPEGRTSKPGLYAVGEVACTGMHGANRMASNSLLEALVMGRRAAMAPEREDDFFGHRQTGGYQLEMPAPAPIAQPVDRARLQELNWEHLGIVRDESGLREAAVRSKNDGSETLSEHSDRRWLETRNLNLVSGLMARAALARTESRGAQYRSDFPAMKPELQGHIVQCDWGSFFVPVGDTVLAASGAE